MAAAPTTTLNSRFRPSLSLSMTCIRYSSEFGLIVQKLTAFPAGTHNYGLMETVVRVKGLEPLRPFGHEDLNLACLPVPPHPLTLGSLPAVAVQKRPWLIPNKPRPDQALIGAGRCLNTLTIQPAPGARLRADPRQGGHGQD